MSNPAPTGNDDATTPKSESDNWKASRRRPFRGRQAASRGGRSSFRPPTRYITKQAPARTDIDEAAGETDPVEFELRKRLPPRMPRRLNDVYVTRRCDFEAQFARCRRLFDRPGITDVTIYGLGLGVNRAVNLALRLEAHMKPLVQLDVRTETLHVTDDLLPIRDDLDPQTQGRNLSAVKIRVSYVRTAAGLVAASSSGAKPVSANT